MRDPRDESNAVATLMQNIQNKLTDGALHGAGSDGWVSSLQGQYVPRVTLRCPGINSSGLWSLSINSAFG